MKNLSGEKWHFYNDIRRHPAVNMAIDELLLERIEILNGRPILRIYGWNRPSVSIGYSQKFSSVSEEKRPIVRRPTGGGIVYHDRDLTYTVVLPSAHAFAALSRADSYLVFHRTVLRALESLGIKGILAQSSDRIENRTTMKCFVSPAKYDVLCEGHKIAGAAQRKTRKGILHQGSILLKAPRNDRDTLAECLRKAFVSEFNITFEDFVPPENFPAEAEKLAFAKFASDWWNRSK